MMKFLRAWRRQRQDLQEYLGLVLELERLNAADVDDMDARPIACGARRVFEGGKR